MSKNTKHSGTESDGKQGSFRNSLPSKKHESTKMNESSQRKSPVRKLTENATVPKVQPKREPKVQPNMTVKPDQKMNVSKEDKKIISETMSPVTPPLPEKPKVPLPPQHPDSTDAPPLPSDEPPPLPPEEEKPPPPALPPLPLPPVLPGLPDESPVSEMSETSELPKGENLETPTDSKSTTPAALSTPGKSEDESEEEGEWGERCVDTFDIIAIVGEGTFGQVYKAKEKLTGIEFCVIVSSRSLLILVSP